MSDTPMDHYHRTNPPTELKSVVLGRENSRKALSNEPKKAVTQYSSLIVLRELLDAIENFGYGASMMHPRITRAISRAKKHAENSQDQCQ